MLRAELWDENRQLRAENEWLHTAMERVRRAVPEGETHRLAIVLVVCEWLVRYGQLPEDE